MPEPASRAADNPYILATGDAGAERLHLLERLAGDFSLEILSAAGLGEGSRVLDLGCGVGDMTLWVAGTVGDSGHVTAVDASEAQLAIAKTQCEREGVSNVDFRCASAEATGLPDGSFDIAIARFLLCHVSDPRAVLREMKRVVKPGGAIIAMDPDVSTVRSDPPSSAFERMNEIAERAGQLRGADYRIGPKLHRHFRDAGLEPAGVRVIQPAHLRGNEKRFWEYTYLEAAPAMIRAGLLTESEMDVIAEGMRAVSEDEHVLLLSSTMTAVWGYVA